MEEATANLPPGFRFLPTDEELVVHFLYRKAALLPCQPDIIPTLNLHQYDPWELNGKALQGGNKWYFFSLRTQNRASVNGYWNSIEVDETITSCGRIVGLKKSLIYCIGQAPEGIRTNWVMKEYHLLDNVAIITGSSSNGGGRRSSRRRGLPRIELDKWVVCQVYEAACGAQASFYDNETELSCLDELFWSLDDLEEISLPN